MDSRERVLKALNHERPDRVPVDLGATSVTGISASALTRLRRALDLEEKVTRVHEPFQLLGDMEEDVRQALGVDVVGLWSPYTIFGYENNGWKPWQLPDGIKVFIGEGFAVTVDENGNQYTYPQGDMSVPPSGKLPKGGFYFDNLTRQEEVDEDNLDGRRDFADDFKIFSDYDLSYYEKTANELYHNTRYAIIANFGGGGLGDVAFLPGPSVKKTPGIRRIEDWYMAYVLHPDYTKEVYDFQVEVALKNLELLRQAVGDKIQAIFVSGTDFGTQRAEFISPDMFREFYKPRFKQINDWIHAHTTWKTFYHSCGSIVNLLDDMVDAGVDILNPVQCSAAGMDPKYLKEKYGDKLVFWGGGIDTQNTLPFGTPEEVRKEALERLEIFSKGGGYVFNPIHNIQAPTPVENLTALFEAVKEFNER
ncbi:methylcobalamin:coenzyme M methyltransferase [Peptococcaceae bacterium CEB3]|nr:methylcobalamin:coenzyme M methyltransferase [Peptococcaceae bacterium CEB3]